LVKGILGLVSLTAEAVKKSITISMSKQDLIVIMSTLRSKRKRALTNGIDKLRHSSSTASKRPSSSELNVLGP
jgi:hypothetical protein